MKNPRLFSLYLLVFTASFLAASLLRADDLTPLVVNKPVADIIVPVGTASSTVKIKKTFVLQGVAGQVVRFATSVEGADGSQEKRNIDVQLLADSAPATVANFLNYVNKGAYTNSFFHRLATNFVLQGGGYYVADGQVNTIPADPAVVNEFRVSNTRGTMAMAKLGNDPNSATDEWFFNLNDNSANLDQQNGGFTVFASVIGNGLEAIDEITALPVVNAGSPFDTLPVTSAYKSGDQVTVDDLVYVDSVTPLPLLPKKIGDPSLLKVNAKSSNPGLVTPTFQNGKTLVLTYAPGASGTATISLVAKGLYKGSKAKTSFTVTVR